MLFYLNITIQFNVSALSDSDIGDQYMMHVTLLADFQYDVDHPLFPTSE